MIRLCNSYGDSYGMSNSYAAAITFGQTLETVKEISELIESL